MSVPNSMLSTPLTHSLTQKDASAQPACMHGNLIGTPLTTSRERKIFCQWRNSFIAGRAWQAFTLLTASLAENGYDLKGAVVGPVRCRAQKQRAAFQCWARTFQMAIGTQRMLML